MAVTYESIASNTLGSAQATVSFNSISGSYTDLILVVSGATSSGTQGITIQVNSDTGTNYSRTILQGDGSAAGSSRESNATTTALGVLDTGLGNSIFHFMNYANTTTYKTILARGNAAGSQTRAAVGLWRSTSAITSITLGLQANNFISGTIFALYGVKAA